MRNGSVEEVLWTVDPQLCFAGLAVDKRRVDLLLEPLPFVEVGSGPRDLIRQR
jgi:hypothetical protein